MTSINDLLKKGGSQNAKNNPAKNPPQIQTGLRDGKNNPSNSGIQQSGAVGKKPLGIKFKLGKNKPSTADAPIKSEVLSEKPFDLSPMQQLSDNLKNNPKSKFPSIKSVLSQDATPNETSSQTRNAENAENAQQSNHERPSERRSGFDNPTLEDVSKFVFKEQPDDSTVDVTEKFSNMLDDLSESLGADVPTNLAKCLKFMQEHAFLAEILKPANIGDLVTAMRKSYGFIVKGQSEKQVKKAKKQQKENSVLDDLAGLSF